MGPPASTSCQREAGEDPDDDLAGEEEAHPAQSIISCFLCGWFITGTRKLR